MVVEPLHVLSQAAGGGFMTSTNPNTFKTGACILTAGLSLQALSFVLFILLVYHAYRSLKRDGMKPYDAPWGNILRILFFSSGCFLVRRFYVSRRGGNRLRSG